LSWQDSITRKGGSIQAVFHFKCYLTGQQWNINQFELTYILTRGGPGTLTQILSTYTYQLFFAAFQFSAAATVATVMLVIMMVLTVFYIRQII
jgi:ABC-type sugar transport system permease subunit